MNGGYTSVYHLWSMWEQIVHSCSCRCAIPPWWIWVICSHHCFLWTHPKARGHFIQCHSNILEFKIFKGWYESFSVITHLLMPESNQSSMYEVVWTTTSKLCYFQIAHKNTPFPFISVHFREDSPATQQHISYRCLAGQTDKLIANSLSPGGFNSNPHHILLRPDINSPSRP